MYLNPILKSICLCMLAFFLAQMMAAHSYGAENHKIKLMIREEARNLNVPPALALAVAKVESDFRPHAVSSAGARGIMQVMPQTAEKTLGVPSSSLWKPRQNIRAGLRYLNQLYNLYDNQWDLALSHYNGGSLRKINGRYRPHSYTAGYLNKVKKWRRKFRESEIMDAQYIYAGRNAGDLINPFRHTVAGSEKMTQTAGGNYVTMLIPGQDAGALAVDCRLIFNTDSKCLNKF